MTHRCPKCNTEVNRVINNVSGSDQGVQEIETVYFWCVECKEDVHEDRVRKEE